MGLKLCIKDFTVTYVDDLYICWYDSINEEHPGAALDEFLKWLLPIIDKHAPVKKLTVRTAKVLWIDEELNNCMVERDGGGGGKE
jgi:hypothetical protein